MLLVLIAKLIGDLRNKNEAQKGDKSSTFEMTGAYTELAPSRRLPR
jgi:hypothetical protein